VKAVAVEQWHVLGAQAGSQPFGAVSAVVITVRSRTAPGAVAHRGARIATSFGRVLPAWLDWFSPIRLAGFIEIDDDAVLAVWETWF
jgi:hypothetical protein